MTRDEEARRTYFCEKDPAAAREGLQVGYLRVSAVNQSELRRLEGFDPDQTFTDKAFGGDVQLLQLDLMLSFIREATRWSAI